MKTLNLEQMQNVQGGIATNKAVGCAMIATGVMLAAIETGPFALAAGLLTNIGCELTS